MTSTVLLHHPQFSKTTPPTPSNIRLIKVNAVHLNNKVRLISSAFSFRFWKSSITKKQLKRIGWKFLNLGSVWIELFTEIENWKFCNKIIFKCVNSTVWLIFNEKIIKKWYLWVNEQCIHALFTVEKSTFATESDKKKKPVLKRDVNAANADPNCTLTVALWTQNLEIFLGLHSMTPLVGFRLYFSVTINIGERLVTTLFSIFFIRCEFWQIHNLNYIFFLYILYLQNFHKTKNQ